MAEMAEMAENTWNTWNTLYPRCTHAVHTLSTQPGPTSMLVQQRHCSVQRAEGPQLEEPSSTVKAKRRGCAAQPCSMQLRLEGMANKVNYRTLSIPSFSNLDSRCSLPGHTLARTISIFLLHANSSGTQL